MEKKQFEKRERVYLGGLWWNDKGNMASGKLGFASRMVLFVESDKRSEKDPDLKLYLEAVPKDQER